MKPSGATASPQPTSGVRRQPGFALLIMLIIVVMGSMFAVTSQLEFASRKYSRDEATLKSLALAKEALIGFAATYRDTHPDINGNLVEVLGYLPCPDTATGNGDAASTCGSAGQAAVGLLPYKTLGLPDLRDSDGVCLWYAVSGTAKNSPKASATVMNWDTQGQFSISGTSIAPDQGDGGAVAVVFAAGIPVAGQSRSVSGSNPCQIDPTQAAAYLDGSYNFATSGAIAVTPGIVTDSDGNITNNDRIAWITPKEIFDKIVKRADFGNPLTSTPVGGINKLSDEIKAGLELEIQNDLVAGTTTSQPRNSTNGTYNQFAGKQIGDLQTGLALATAYASYYTNWNEQYRQVTCSPLTACLTIAGLTCRGGLMFAGRTAQDQIKDRCGVTPAFTSSGAGQPRPSGCKTSSTTNLNYYFEAGGGLDILNSASNLFTGTTSYAAASPSADVGICLVPGVIDSFAQDIASFTRVVTSAVRPEATISVAAQTVTLGNTSATAAGSGCVWFPTQLPFISLLRAYYKFNIANLGEGFIYAIVDAAKNQAAMAGGTLCGTTTSANYSQMGYSSTSPGILPPKFGLEIDTRVPASQTTSPCSALARDDPGSNHMAFVYWGSAASTSDDNCHGSTAGTLGSGSEPLNPRTPLAGALTPVSTVGTSVSSASWSSNVAVITTASAHGRASNQQVTISGVTPTGYNGTYAIEVIDATHIAYSLASNPGSYTSGGSVTINAGIKNVQSSDTMLPYSGTLPLATDIHVRIDASKAYDATLIQAASWSSNTAVITTAAAHGLLSNQRVTISGSGGYDGTYTINVTDATNFTYSLGADPGTYTSGGVIRPPLGITVAGASRAAAGSAWVVTITTAAAHGFVSGQPVTISGITPAAYNGTSQIVVTDSTHFTYALGANPGAYTSGGTLTSAVALTLKVYVASNFPNCTLTDFQNLSRDLSTLCSQNPTIEQDNVYMNVDAASGLMLSSIYTGFVNAQNTTSSSNQSVVFSNFIIRTQ